MGVTGILRRLAGPGQTADTTVALKLSLDSVNSTALCRVLAALAPLGRGPAANSM